MQCIEKSSLKNVCHSIGFCENYVFITHTCTLNSVTHMLPLLSDEWPVSKEVFQREVVDVWPGGGALPGYLQPPCVVTDRGCRHTLWWVWFDWDGGELEQSVKGAPH